MPTAIAERVNAIGKEKIVLAGLWTSVCIGDWARGETYDKPSPPPSPTAAATVWA